MSAFVTKNIGQGRIAVSNAVCTRLGGLENFGDVWAYKLTSCNVKVKEADLYSAFIKVPHTQGAQVRITQCYLQITPYLPLPRKHSPDGASQTEGADI